MLWNTIQESVTQFPPMNPHDKGISQQVMNPLKAVARPKGHTNLLKDQD